MRGEHAPIEPRESVAGMLRVIERLDSRGNGGFLDWRGRTRAW